MKLSELKPVLADSIESYGCVVKREENGDMYEFEYELQVQKQDAAIRFFNLLFHDNVYEELKDLEVVSVFSTEHGFSVYLNVEDSYLLFENIAKDNKIPLKITKTIIVED